MKILTVLLKAGIPQTIGRGRFVRLLEGQFPVEIETQALNTQSNQRGDLIANVGAEFHTFERATIVSEKEQRITLAYSELPIFDNRLGVNGALVVESVARGADRVKIKRVNVSGRTELLAMDERRRSAMIHPESAITVFTEASGGEGFVIDGVLVHDCQAALYAEGSGVVEVMEYIN